MDHLLPAEVQQFTIAWAVFDAPRIPRVLKAPPPSASSRNNVEAFTPGLSRRQQGAAASVALVCRDWQKLVKPHLKEAQKIRRIESGGNSQEGSDETAALRKATGVRRLAVHGAIFDWALLYGRRGVLSRAPIDVFSRILIVSHSTLRTLVLDDDAIRTGSQFFMEGPQLQGIFNLAGGRIRLRCLDYTVTRATGQAPGLFKTLTTTSSFHPGARIHVRLSDIDTDGTPEVRVFTLLKMVALLRAPTQVVHVDWPGVHRTVAPSSTTAEAVNAGIVLAIGVLAGLEHVKEIGMPDFSDPMWAEFDPKLHWIWEDFLERGGRVVPLELVTA